MSDVICQNCCECGNCVRCCPCHAVTLNRDAYGNCRAVIDAALCINCGACRKACPMLSPAPCTTPTAAYAAVSTAPEAAGSTSGGIFFELARTVLSDGGLVVGAAYNKDWSVSHILIHDVRQLPLLQGSKYAKSDVVKAIPQIKDALRTGRTVLFSGTPCQVAALKLDLREPELQQRLITVDLVCHGTPPVNVFQDYVNHLEAKHRGKLSCFSFRDKKYGAKLIGSYGMNKNGKVRTYPLYAAESAYYHLFLKGLTYTSCCYSCPYASAQRCSDITIGDFWGWQQEIPAFTAEHGLPADASVSAVLINSPKGLGLFHRIRDGLCAQEVPYEAICRHNDQLQAPVHVDRTRYDRVRRAYCAEGYAGLMGIYREMTDFRRYSVRLAGLLPIGLKQAVKKLLRR